MTLTAGLDGMGELRLVDSSTALAQVPRGQAPPLAEAQALARRLGAGRLIQGAVTRSGSDFRVDVSLFDAGSAEAIARASATAEDLPGLTDQAIIALLDELWEREPPQAPSLAALKHSRVPAARRAYLEGELALARLDMAAAVEAFESAFAADPTFWWAYWRSLYPRSSTEEPADPALVQQVIEHRWELPQPDRLMVEAWTADSRVEYLARLRELLDRFYFYTPAWWSYANGLVHTGPYLGHTAEDARTALEQFLKLSPDFAAAWEHLLWVAVMEGDGDTALRALRERERLGADIVPRRDWITVLRLRAEVTRSRLIPPERLGRTVDFILSTHPDLAKILASGFVADGLPAAQNQLNPAVRERDPVRSLDAALWRGEALAWAARGAWDSALVAAARWAAVSGEAEGMLGAYRLAVAGATLGAVPVPEALGWRPGSSDMLSRWSADELAELAWLDGLLAYLENDAQRMASARRAVSDAEATYGALLERSLAALAADAAGNRRRAAREIVELETEIADREPLKEIGTRHPLLAIANRLLAARWLRSLGEDLEAARLLTWHEAMPGPVLIQAWNRSIGDIAFLDRAEIAESIGDEERAQRYFARFLEQYDRPDPTMRPLVDRATAGLVRLGPEPKG